MKKETSTMIGTILIIFIFMNFLPFLQLFLDWDPEESTGPNDYARITDVEYKAVLDDSTPGRSRMVVTERLTYDIHAASKNNLFWELWRDLPEDTVDGLKVYYKVNYVNEIKDDGTRVPYTESPILYWDDSDYTDLPYGPGKWYHSEGPYYEEYDQYECVFFYIDGIYRDEITFEVQYEIYNTALKYSDVSELYLSMYSEETIEHLESFKAEILIPDEDMPKDGNYTAYMLGTDSNILEYDESDRINPGYHTFYFELDEDDLKFSSYNQYIEFLMLAYNEDKHVFTDNAPNNNYSHETYLAEAMADLDDYLNAPAKAKKFKLLVFAGCVGVSLIIIISLLNKDKKIRKQHVFYTPSQQMVYYRDIPSDLDPYFAAQIVFSKSRKKADDGDAYAAILLNLVRKEYIELQKINPAGQWDFNNILIKLLYVPDNLINTSSVTTINTQNGTKIITNANIPTSVVSRPIFPTMAGDMDNDHLEESDYIPQIVIDPTPLIPGNNNSVDNVQTVTTVTATLTPPTPAVSVPIELININGKKLEKLSLNEQAYFNMITRYTVNGTITMKYFQEKVANDYDNTDNFVTSLDNSLINIGIKEGYFQKVGFDDIKRNLLSLSSQNLIFGILIVIFGNMIISRTRLDFAYGGLFILGIVLIIAAFYYRHISCRYILFTQLGEDEYAKWKGLYDFLNSETLIKERTVVELPLWEKYLVYATAFGIADKVSKAIEICCPDASTSPILNNNYYRSSSYRSSSRTFRTHTRNASYTSRSIRSGGYYGGGGRGGGGGGGGH